MKGKTKVIERRKGRKREKGDGERIKEREGKSAKNDRERERGR